MRTLIPVGCFLAIGLIAGCGDDDTTSTSGAGATTSSTTTAASMGGSGGSPTSSGSAGSPATGGSGGSGGAMECAGCGVIFHQISPAEVCGGSCETSASCTLFMNWLTCACMDNCMDSCQMMDDFCGTAPAPSAACQACIDMNCMTEDTACHDDCPRGATDCG